MNVTSTTETREIQRTVTEKVEEKTIVITLTETEAAALAAVIGQVGGPADSSNVRPVTDSLYDFLYREGVGWGSGAYFNFSHNLEGRLEVLVD